MTPTNCAYGQVARVQPAEERAGHHVDPAAQHHLARDGVRQVEVAHDARGLGAVEEARVPLEEERVHVAERARVQQPGHLPHVTKGG